MENKGPAARAIQEITFLVLPNQERTVLDVAFLEIVNVCIMSVYPSQYIGIYSHLVSFCTNRQTTEQLKKKSLCSTISRKLLISAFLNAVLQRTQCISLHALFPAKCYNNILLHKK